MKKYLILTIVLALALTSCGSLAATQPAPTPVPPTPQIVVATVLVTAVSTEAPPTPLPMVTPLPPPTEMPTQEEAPTEAAAPTQEDAPLQPADSGPIDIPASFNGGMFSNMSISTDKFSLRCTPKDISFDITATDIYITRVDLYYRIRDKHSNYVPEWSVGATFETDGGNHFWLTFSGDDVIPDNRKDSGWFDFQFVGLNKLGQAVGRSEKITDLVSYTTNCP